ncbi:MAG: hypothetical protein ABIG44_10595, partial [Planctomycetota bacterium]
MNDDGIISYDDINAFVLAWTDPEAWCEQYEHNERYLLRIADFNDDGYLDLDDIPDFGKLIADNLPAHPGLPLAMTQNGSDADLDIDSDNDMGTDPPDYADRDDDEDVIEDDPYLTGKQIDIDAANDTPAVLEFAPTGETELVDLTLRLTFPDEIDIVIPLSLYGSAQSLTSGTTYDYPYSNEYTHGILADMNHDGNVNSYDISGYILALGNPSTYESTYYQDAILTADMNGDWELNGYDTDAFIAAVGSQTEDPIPVHLEIDGVAVSAAQGETRIFAEADADGDEEFDAEDEIDAVRVTAYDDTLPVPGGAGATPAWGAGLPVSPFSSVNLRNGNVLTAIPLVAFDPVGPPVAFTLYHNSLSASYAADYSAWGFDLGDGWSVSYGSYIDGTDGDETVAVVGADGSRTVFTAAGSDYVAPAGVHNTLVWDSNDEEWTLTSPGQTRAIYNEYGALTEVYDSAGMGVTVHRDGQDRIDYVMSAADDFDGLNVVGKHRLVFTYDDGLLDTITDPLGREWSFEYDGSYRLEKINLPYEAVGDLTAVPAVYLQFEYATGNRIEDIHVKHDAERDEAYHQQWTYTYTDGLLTLVQDPEHEVDPQTTVRYEQELDYDDTLSNDDLWETTYTDRRGNDWVY